MNIRFPTILFKTLLRFYPKRFRQNRGSELDELYRDMWEEMAPQGLARALGFRARLVLDLLLNACGAWRIGGFAVPELTLGATCCRPCRGSTRI